MLSFPFSSLDMVVPLNFLAWAAGRNVTGERASRTVRAAAKCRRVYDFMFILMLLECVS